MAILSTTTAKLIIQEALEMIGALGEGELANADQEASTLRSLNTLATTWQADGLNLFAVTKYNLFLDKGRQKYVIPDADTHIAVEYDTSRLTNDEPSGTTVLPLQTVVDTTHTMAKVGNHWSAITINSGNSITIADALPDDLPQGTPVFTHGPQSITRPMRIVHGSLLQFTGNSIPMDQLAREEYESLSRKDPTGIPLQYYYDYQTTIGNLYVWPTSSTDDHVLDMYVQRQLDTALSVTDNVEYPAEWFLPLASNLAVLLSAKYGLPRDEFSKLERIAMKYYDMARGFDFEWETSVFFAPDNRGNPGA